MAGSTSRETERAGRLAQLAQQLPAHEESMARYIADASEPTRSGPFYGLFGSSVRLGVHALAVGQLEAARQFFFEGGSFALVGIKRAQKYRAATQLTTYGERFWVTILSDCEFLMAEYAKLKIRDVDHNPLGYGLIKCQQAAMARDQAKLRRAVGTLDAAMNDRSRSWRGVITGFQALAKGDVHLFTQEAVPEMLRTHSKRNSTSLLWPELFCLDCLAMIRLANRIGMNVPPIPTPMLGPVEFQRYAPLERYASRYEILRELNLPEIEIEA